MASTKIPKRGLPCVVKCGLFLLLCLVLRGGVWAYFRYQASSQTVESATNLRELGSALFNYAQNNSGNYPDRLSELLLDTDADPKLFVAPWGSATPAMGSTPQQRAAQMDAGGHCSYGYLGAGHREGELTAEMVLMYTEDGDYPIEGKTFLLWGDGHGSVESFPDAIAGIIKTLTSSTATTRPASAPALP